MPSWPTFEKVVGLLWREPETGRRLSPPHAAELLRQKDWPRPSSGRLYPRGGAHDLLLLSTVEEGG